MRPMQLDMLFVSHFPTHATVWQILQIVGSDPDYSESLVSQGCAVEDREGTYWIVSCYWFPTNGQAQRFTEDQKNAFRSWKTVQVRQLSN